MESNVHQYLVKPTLHFYLETVFPFFNFIAFFLTSPLNDRCFVLGCDMGMRALGASRDFSLDDDVRRREEKRLFHVNGSERRISRGHEINGVSRLRIFCCSAFSFPKSWNRLL